MPDIQLWVSELTKSTAFISPVKRLTRRLGEMRWKYATGASRVALVICAWMLRDACGVAVCVYAEKDSPAAMAQAAVNAV